ncbi:MAG: GAF domain-containing protein [Pseudomonadota bacterium]
MNAEEKKRIYENAAKEIAAVIDGEPNLTARMATVSNILHHAFEHFFWTGFYVVDPEKDAELVVGPYQGTMGCLRIPFDRGVCGAATSSGETVIVEDVHAFPGHIACDANSRSEIVVPVRDGDGALIAVLDVDSDEPAMFDDTDRAGLEKIIAESFR